MKKILAALLLAPSLAHGAITYVGVGTASNATDGGVITPSVHASTTTGDLVVCLIGQKAGTDYTILTSSGYTMLYGANPTGHSAIALLGKIATGSDTVSVDSSDNTGGRTVIGQCSTFRGTLDTVTGIVAHSATTDGASQAYLGTPALTVSTDNTAVVVAGFREAMWDTDDPGALATMTEIGQPNRTTSATVALKWDYVIQTTAANISADTSTWLSTLNTADYASLAISIKPAAASAPTWSVSPTVSAQDTNDYTLSYTPSTSATFYAVACKKDQTAPSIAQVKAGNCTGDVAAVAAANEAVTGADTTVLGGSLTYPIHDLYAVLSNGGGDSTLATLADEMLDPATGYQYDLLASVSTTSPCKALNDIPISPTIAAADVTKWPTTTSPSGYAFTAGTDCDTQYTDPAGTRQTATLDVYDTSAGDWMSGTTTVYYNNTPPSCLVSNCEYDTGTSFINGVAMDAVAISTWFDDEDTGDTRTITTSSTGTGTGADKIPAGTAIDGSGNWTGTPACASADTSGSFTATATDEAGDTETVDVSWTCYDQVSVPDCDGIDAASCAALAAAVNLDVDATFECSDTVVENGVISQDPAATTVVDPFTSFDITASSGACSGISPWTTVFLDDVTAVPSSAVFVEGAAMSQAGARYVAALPGSGVTFSQRGLKYRGDGALVIEASGSITHYVRGIGLTVDGEVAAALCSPDYSVAGVPMDPDGTVCMTDIN